MTCKIDPKKTFVFLNSYTKHYLADLENNFFNETTYKNSDVYFCKSRFVQNMDRPEIIAKVYAKIFEKCAKISQRTANRAVR
jgi:hypothetical protein